MSKILLVSANPVHQKLYARGLASYYDLVTFATLPEVEKDIEAVVYDMDEADKSQRLSRLEHLDRPVVVLTSRDVAWYTRTPGRCVLTYPVRTQDIVQALARLGVPPEAGGQRPRSTESDARGPNDPLKGRTTT
jgi:hypothetical protein